MTNDKKRKQQKTNDEFVWLRIVRGNEIPATAVAQLLTSQNFLNHFRAKIFLKKNTHDYNDDKKKFHRLKTKLHRFKWCLCVYEMENEKPTLWLTIN